MRIALDCRCVYEGMGGIGRYAWSLLQEYLEIDRSNTYFCYFTHLPPPEPVRLPDNFRVRIFESGMIDERFDQMVLPAVLRDDEIDLYHNPTFSIPTVRTRTRLVSTVHDVVFKRHPELVQPRLRAFLEAATRRAGRGADRVITVSHFSKSEIAALYPIEPERILVIPNGVHPPCAVGDAPLDPLGLEPRRFFLYVGSIEAKKNIEVLLRAFQGVLRLRPSSGTKLVLAGNRDGAFDVEGRVRELGLAAAVVAPGYVSADTLESLYKNALVFVYPSLYEGFGLPPLEAMARGTPTVVADTSSLPEVVGDGAVRVDPKDSDGLARELLKFMEDEAHSDEFARRGKDRAASFTWRKSAEEHLSLFESVMSRS